MKRLATVLSLALMAACSKTAPPAATQPPELSFDRAGFERVVGRRVRGDSVPVQGARFERAWLVTAVTDTGAAWSLRHLKRGERNVIVMQREVAREGALPVWVVTDAGQLPALPRGFLLATSCGPGPNNDPRLFAVVRAGPAERLVEVRWAWLANIATGKIDTTATLGMQCANETMAAP